MGRRRAFGLAIARDVALRTLVLSEGGHRRRVLGGIGPGLADCPDSSTGYLLGFDLAPPRFGSEPPALKLRDEGTLLCATLGLPGPVAPRSIVTRGLTTRRQRLRLPTAASQCGYQEDVTW